MIKNANVSAVSDTKELDGVKRGHLALLMMESVELCAGMT